MSNYIKIPMEDGTALTTGALAASSISGGGTITGFDARNGVTVFTQSGEGSGATVDVTMGDRALDPASSVLTDPTSYGTAGQVGFATTAGTATLSAVIGGGTFDIEVNTDGADGTILSVAVNAAGGYKVGDVITIDVPSGSPINASGGDQLITVVALSDSDLVAAAISDLVFTVVDAGSGYANGDVLFLDIQASGPADEISWDAAIEIDVAGLSGYDDGPYIILPVGNVLCVNPNPMAASTAVVIYADAQVGGALNQASIEFSGITTADERLEITKSLNEVILKANRAENSQPTLVLPNGVQGLQVTY